MPTNRTTLLNLPVTRWRTSDCARATLGHYFLSSHQITDHFATRRSSAQLNWARNWAFLLRACRHYSDRPTTTITAPVHLITDAGTPNSRAIKFNENETFQMISRDHCDKLDILDGKNSLRSAAMMVASVLMGPVTRQLLCGCWPFTLVPHCRGFVLATSRSFAQPVSFDCQANEH